MSSILIKNAQIVTMADYILHGDVYIEDDKIVEVSGGIKRDAEKVIDAEGMILMPGLVNAHTHVGMSVFRGYSDERELMDWLTKAIWPVEDKLTADDVYVASLLSCIEMIKSGTTTFNDMYFFEEATAKAAEETGLRCMLARCIIGDSVADADTRAADAVKLYEDFDKKAYGRINICFSAHAPYTCSKYTLQKVVELCKKYNKPLHIHFLETKDEIKQMREKHDSRAIDYLKDAGVFDVKTILAHGVWVDEYDLLELQLHDTAIINNPISNCKLGSGIGDMKFLIEGGINVGLGTDGQGSTGTLDMFEEIKNAAYSQKVLYKMATAISAKKVLEMATINGAKALGLQNEIGTIEPGKKADLILIDTNKPHLVPCHNTYSLLAYAVNGADVDTTIINGNIVMEHRKLVGIDEEHIMCQAREITKKIFSK